MQTAEGALREIGEMGLRIYELSVQKNSGTFSATETGAELARTQIINQAATAMLAQANQPPQAVLTLLQ